MKLLNLAFRIFGLAQKGLMKLSTRFLGMNLNSTTTAVGLFVLLFALIISGKLKWAGMVFIGLVLLGLTGI
ncbi:hypothetical protein AKJ58_00130 [candidate division MSBL1 archaeon SCGC-AAA385D11]|uniref:Uncharacterized protein n=1 Tax=candidate division MSBL1 archaeon SCGC-AAA385D11 TaxID=1698286 RepID=A0A133VPI2_9EURY|nr:hypothetical protein AKJ58_00130 [candidate division MSBL1 archaeon SCGC-AAA385D11]